MHKVPKTLTKEKVVHDVRLYRRQHKYSRRSESAHITGNLVAYRSEFASLPMVQVRELNGYATINVAHKLKSTPVQASMTAAGLICISAILANTMVSPTSATINDISLFGGNQHSSPDSLPKSPSSVESHTQMSVMEAPTVIVDAVSANKLSALSSVYESKLTTQKIHFEEQINELSGVKEQLETVVSDLQDETLELNQVLLGKELELLSLKNATTENVETRIVYNFVNVPIGSDIDNADDVQPEFLAQEEDKAFLAASDSWTDDSEFIKEPEFDSLQDVGLGQSDDDFSDEYINGLFTELDEQFSDEMG